MVSSESTTEVALDVGMGEVPDKLSQTVTVEAIGASKVSSSKDHCFGENLCCSSLLHRVLWHRLCILHERGEVVGLANLVLFDGYGFDGWLWRHEPYSWMGRLVKHSPSSVGAGLSIEHFCMPLQL